MQSAINNATIRSIKIIDTTFETLCRETAVIFILNILIVIRVMLFPCDSSFVATLLSLLTSVVCNHCLAVVLRRTQTQALLIMRNASSLMGLFVSNYSAPVELIGEK